MKQVKLDKVMYFLGGVFVVDLVFLGTGGGMPMPNRFWLLWLLRLMEEWF